jgi:transcriptional regulator with XRE-family HTH domain
MPLNTELLPTYSRPDFCLALKRARERKGITLAEIAQNTKIPAFLFADLERNELRRWPKGLFRRSFFRDYARMIGLPVAEACAEFVRLFPDDPSAELTPPPEAATEADQETDLRLSLDSEWHGPRASVLARLLAASIDTAIVLMAGEAVWMWGLERSWITAIFVLAYFSVGTVLFGESPAKHALARRHEILDALTQASKAIRSTGKPVADIISAGFLNPEADTPEPPQRLRVRIKVP